MADSAVTNGANGTHTPPMPRMSNLSLTEYTANPSPPSSTPKEKTAAAGVPAHFLLPTGYPDVRSYLET